jgi:coenzyme F420-dependent glucose-6-phosphate dehydrogenase
MANMKLLSYQASHEQFSPGELLRLIKKAELAGFTSCHSSDHFHPWSTRQAHSGHVYTWLGAALEATRFPIYFITTPGQRYHPAVVAQAIATLEEMYPNRLGVSLGSGEALNEHITGAPWPEKAARNKRLFECASIIRNLLNGEKVNHWGLVNVHEAKLYTLPKRVPPLNCAALSPETARWSGHWADGLLTAFRSLHQLKSIIQAFRAGGGEGKPIHVKLTFSYDRDLAKAKESAFEQWRTNSLDPRLLASIHTVEQFDAAGDQCTMESVLKTIPVSSQLDDYIELISGIFSLGVDHIVLHNVGLNQDIFIEDFATEVLPHFKLNKLAENHL